MNFKSAIILVLVWSSCQLGATAQIKLGVDTLLQGGIVDSIKQAESLRPSSQQPVVTKTITGLVIDKESREPVPFATVFIPNTPIGTVTEYAGVFTLDVTKRPHDTLKVQLVGYKPFTVLLRADTGIYLIEMEVNDNVLSELVVRPKEDPAIALIKEVVRHKPENDPAKWDNYGYEAYTKIELDLLNLSKEQFESLPVPMLKKFSYIYDNLDTTGEQSFLPFYLTETISDYYYQKKPNKVKEFVRASRVKGINNKNMTNSMSKYLGNLYLALAPYDKYIEFFGKPYVSPISASGLLFYQYRIIDTTYIDGDEVIELKFWPKQYGTNTFDGTIKIVNEVYALQYIEATLPKSANLNWVKDAKFYKKYLPINDSNWFCVQENFTAEILMAQEEGLLKMPGMIVRRTNSYKDIKVNSEQVKQKIDDPKLKLAVTVADSATNDNDTYWQQARHNSLNKNEQAIYNMIDTIEADPKYQRFRKYAKILMTGMVKAGPVEFGPYWSMYSNNLVEGNRYRFSMGTTPKLSKKIYLNGYVAYGMLDQRFKYNFTAFYLMKRYPRTYFNFTYTHDIDRTVNYYDQVSFDNILNVAIRKKGIPQKLMFATDVRFEYYKEYASGFSHQFNFIHKIFDPYDPLPDASIFTSGEGKPTTTVTASEFGVQLRYAPGERFIEGNYYRYSLGAKKPIFQLRYAAGIKGVLNSNYNYHRLNLSVSDKIKIPLFGSLYVNVFGGKYWGDLPYTLLEQHPGNETYYYNKLAFNMMNQYEFLSDQFVGANIEHSIGSGIFRYIPYVKKLKFRQFWTAKGVVGSLDAANRAINLNKGFMFRTLENDPYVELGTGVENIFRVLRVDFIWRVTPQSLPNETVLRNFGIFGSMKVAF